MRFDKYPRHVEYEVTPRKVAAAKRAIQADKDKCGLFQEMVVHNTPEERLDAMAIHRREYWQEMRDGVAKTWRKARHQLRALPIVTRAGVARYWGQARCPGHPAYLLTIIRDAANGKSAWSRLAKLRRLTLIGQGRLPRPTSWSNL